MAINKIIYNGGTLIDLTGDTVTADKLMQGYTAHDKTGTVIIGTATPPSVTSLTVTPSSEEQVFDGSEIVWTWPNAESSDSRIPNATAKETDTSWAVPGETYRLTGEVYERNSTFLGDIDMSFVWGSGSTTVIDVKTTGNESVTTLTFGNNTVRAGTIYMWDITISKTTDGYKPVIVEAIPSEYIIPTGTKTITNNGTGIDVTNYASVDVNVSGGGSPTLQTKSVSYTPTETAQSESVTADSGYDGLDTVNVSVGAISSTYVGTGITRRSSSDLTASGATVTVPSGYYSAQASKAVASGTAGTPTATKGTVSNHAVSVTPKVTNTTGYITGSTKTGTAVTVSASELVSGSQTLTSNGTTDVTNLASVTVAVPFVTYYTGSSAPSSSLGQNGDIYLKVVG